jgi:hypothetical protein
VAGAVPGDVAGGEVPAAGAPLEGMPTEGATDPAAMTGSEENPPGASEPEPIVRPEGPCDLYAAATVPCVGAYSMVRALSRGYGGPLYQVRRGAPNPSQNTGAGGETQDIGLLANGFADAAAQQTFCGNQPCTVSTLYDQSGQGNHLRVAPAGCFTGAASEPGFESSAMDAQLTVGGNGVYGLYMRPQEGYRNNDAVNTPEGQEEAGMYMVTAGSGSRPASFPCCWDFGISTRNNCTGPVGSTNALFFGVGFWGNGAGAGPWFLADFEAGLWAGGTAGSLDTGGWEVNPNNPSMTMDYAFGILKSRPSNYALRMGDAQQGNLTTAYDGPTPSAMERWQMGGAIILGIASDNSNLGQGTFFEGAITAGRPSDALDDAILQNVQAAGYGR